MDFQTQQEVITWSIRLQQHIVLCELLTPEKQTMFQKETAVKKFWNADG